MNLKAVHVVIQAVMGWLDCHLWEFVADERKYSLLIPNDPEWNERITDATTTKLSSLVADGVTNIGYVYDMGDNWQHRIIVEKLMPAEPGTRYPRFLGGNGDAHRRIVVDSRATTNFSTTSPAGRARIGKLHSIGTAVPTIRTTSTRSRLSRTSSVLARLAAGVVGKLEGGSLAPRGDHAGI